jgi:hypothetical protein
VSDVVVIFNPEERALQYALNRRQGGFKSQYGFFEEEIHFLGVLRIKP